MHHSMSMAVVNSLDNLIDKALHEVRRKLLFHFSQVLLQVILHILENEVERVMSVNHLL